MSFSKEKSARLSLVGILAVATSLCLVVFFIEPYNQSPPFVSDSGQYYRYAQYIESGGEHMAGDQAWQGEMRWLPPLYPLFIAGFLKTVGFHRAVFFLVQIALSVLVVFLTYRIALRIMSRRSSLIAAVLVGVSPALALCANRVLTEAIYIPLVVGTILFLFCAVRQRSVGCAIACGVCCGGAMLARNVALLLPVPILGCLLVTLPLRRSLVLSVSVILAVGAVWAPWLTYRHMLFGSASIGQLHQTSGRLSQWAHEASLGFMARPSRVEFLYEDPEAAEERYQREIWKPHHTPGHVCPVSGSYFLDHPWEFVQQRFWGAFQFAKPESNGKAFGIRDSFGECLRGGRYDRLALKAVLLAFDSLLLACGAAGAIIGLRRWREFAPLYAIGGYFLTLHLALGGICRYRYPLIPVLAIFAAFFHSLIWRWLAARQRCRKQLSNSADQPST